MAKVRSIEFSEEAAIPAGGNIYSVFQRHTYAAKVRYADEYVVVVVLRDGAARELPQFYLEDVVELADTARDLGVHLNIQE